jgi:hypothetical protein
MKINTFYSSADFCMIAYETKEKAMEAKECYDYALMRTQLCEECIATPWLNEARGAAKYWAKKLNCFTYFSNIDDLIFIVEIEKSNTEEEPEYWKVIIGERVGWIIKEKWMEFNLIEKT